METETLGQGSLLTYNSFDLFDGDVVKQHGAEVLQLRTIRQDAVDSDLGGNSDVGHRLPAVLPLGDVQQPLRWPAVLKQINHLEQNDLN